MNRLWLFPRELGFVAARGLAGRRAVGTDEMKEKDLVKMVGEAGRAS
jgi:hypothetical protein